MAFEIFKTHYMNRIWKMMKEKISQKISEKIRQTYRALIIPICQNCHSKKSLKCMSCSEIFKTEYHYNPLI